MKRFMYASIGILCLSLSALIGFHIGSNTVHAKASAIPGILHVSGRYVLDINGEVWLVSHPFSWIRISDYDPPSTVPPENIVYWSHAAFMTAQGDMWQKTDQWYNCGHPPGGPVPTDNSSWGAIKEKLNTEGD